MSGASRWLEAIAPDGTRPAIPAATSTPPVAAMAVAERRQRRDLCMGVTFPWERRSPCGLSTRLVRTTLSRRHWTNRPGTTSWIPLGPSDVSYASLPVKISDRALDTRHPSVRRRRTRGLVGA